jgi:hypothetical protein
MIQIITEKVIMPELSKRRFQKECKNNKWTVIDTTTNNNVYKGKFEDVCLAWHNLNKNYYKIIL